MTENELYSGLLYGFIQGVTEFLPVSSSGHLALIPQFLSWKDPGVAFDLWMHVGTCLLYTSPSPRDATLSRMPSSA